MVILITLLILAAFLLLTEILTVNIVLSDEKTVEFNLMIFALSLKFGKGRSRGRKKSRKRPNISAVWRFVVSVAEVSEIVIKSLSIPLPDAAPGKEALARGLLFSAVAAFVGFAKENAGFFSLSSIFFNQSAHNNLKLEASVKVPLLRFLTRLIPFLFSYFIASEKNTKGRLKNGGKQNERAD